METYVDELVSVTLQRSRSGAAGTIRFKRSWGCFNHSASLAQLSPLPRLCTGLSQAWRDTELAGWRNARLATLRNLVLANVTSQDQRLV